MYSVAPQRYDFSGLECPTKVRHKKNTYNIIYFRNNGNGSYYAQKALTVKAQKIIDKIIMKPAETVIIVITNTRGLSQKYTT